MEQLEGSNTRIEPLAMQRPSIERGGCEAEAGRVSCSGGCIEAIRDPDH